MKTFKGDALIVIDMQPDFMPGGALAIAGGDEIVKPIAELIPQFETVVFTQDWHPKGHISFASSHKDKKPFEIITLYGQPQMLWPDHCVQGTPMAQIHKDLPLEMASIILRKGMNPGIDSYSAFQENYGPGGRRAYTGLMGMLLEKVVRRIIIVGLARDYCVLWSAQDIGMTIPTTVVWDLTRAVDPSKDEATEMLFRKANVALI